MYETYNSTSKTWDSISWVEQFYDEFDNLIAANAFSSSSDNIYMDSLEYNNSYSLDELVVPWHLGFAKSMFTHQMDITDLNSGLFFLRVKSNGELYSIF